MKKNLHFGRVCAAMMAAACAMSANAQVVTHKGGYNDALVVPSALTVDGKARITLGKRSDEVSIYNKNFEKEASITPATYSYRSGYIKQEATVTLNEVALTSKNPFSSFSRYSGYNSETYKNEEIPASSLEEGLEMLKKFNPYTNYKIYNIGEYSFIYQGSSYYEQSLFGTQYPTSGTFYICKDGYLWSGYANLAYELRYDGNTAVWTTTEDHTAMTEKSVGIVGCRHVNADEYGQIAHSDNDEQLVCTQSFFNDDEDWEYIQYTYEGSETVNAATLKSVNSDGTVTLSRSIDIGLDKNGFRVLNQSGNVILTMTFPTKIEGSGELDLWTINGKSYIQIERESDNGLIIEFYEIEKGTSNVRKVLEQEVPAEEMSEDTTIYDLSGRVLTEKPATGVYIQGGKKYLAK